MKEAMTRIEKCKRREKEHNTWKPPDLAAMFSHRIGLCIQRRVVCRGSWMVVVEVLALFWDVIGQTLSPVGSRGG